VKASHAFSAVSQSFDEPNLVSHGGLLTAAVLTERIGLWALVAGALTVPGPTGVNSAAKTATVLAGMLSGADSIDDLDVLRAGGTRSSWTAGPGVFPLPRRPLRTVLDQSFCCEHSRQTRLSPTSWPARSGSSARDR